MPQHGRGDKYHLLPILSLNLGFSVWMFCFKQRDWEFSVLPAERRRRGLVWEARAFLLALPLLTSSSSPTPVFRHGRLIPSLHAETELLLAAGFPSGPSFPSWAPATTLPFPAVQPNLDYRISSTATIWSAWQAADPCIRKCSNSSRTVPNKI